MACIAWPHNIEKTLRFLWGAVMNVKWKSLETEMRHNASGTIVEEDFFTPLEF